MSTPNAPEIVDCHTHTFYSDGKGTFEENVRAALAAGCTVLACTDHLTLPHEMDPDCECSVAEADLQAHRAAFLDAKERLTAGEFDGGEGSASLELVYGFEADWYEGCGPYIARWRGEATFLLGSIHFVDGMSIDYEKEMEIWDEWGPDAVWRAYADRWCRACACEARFDSMAHPDLVKLFSKSGYAPSIPLEPLWDAMAEAARDAGVHVEISTAGLRKPCADFYPASGLLERFHAAGVPLTAGSDAHVPSDVCRDIDRAYAFAYEHGYRHLDVPTAEGGWRTIEL